ncbi:MAG: 30S ribosomal protein S16 [Planctomycetes bacterium]|jgi:small subunit ribosomal protein S16|nr:30S ribosomal protein S16 [Planctomycetota bacterium]MBT4028501.1 30S ribosomal protein S16 [Planctomycetota bacterium]MBT4559393.1 30S ribosomal protein S16 [Planctomycetota bacterium]MBT5102070.1 30S ribosomal protein S16 [Planctomycetota bacterium]MBT5120813.1 30S ribosomal protein S16 [Planctomycetota bacterium]
MAVVLRLKRLGRKNRPFYRICVMDRQTRRDGRAIEELGWYDPIKKGDGEHFELNAERAAYWISQGAQPSGTVASLLRQKSVPLTAKEALAAQAEA